MASEQNRTEQNRTEQNRTEQNEVILWHEKLNKNNIIDIQPTIVISYSYSHILRADVLDLLPNRFLNLHISLLPYNRGADPNAWSFLENTPKGVSIHLIDAGVDTGKLLIQKEVIFDESSETLGHTYRVLQQEIIALFCEHWEELRDGTIRPISQVGDGTFHYAKEFAKIKDCLLGEEGWDVTISSFKARYNNLIGNKSEQRLERDKGFGGMLAGNVFK